MSFANNMDRDQTPRNVGPDLRSILFVTQLQLVLKTGGFAWNYFNSENIKICQFANCLKTFGGHCIHCKGAFTR